MQKNIVLVPFGHIDSSIINHLSQELDFAFQIPVKFKETQVVPRVAFNLHRNQYRANIFLEVLANLNLSDRALGLTDVDLYNNRHDYVFGATDPQRKVALVSIIRLNPGFYKMLEDIKTYYSRITKEAIYELGFLFNLSKCPQEDCVMHPVANIVDLDLKSERFCGNCSIKLKEFLGRE
ncbi:MAG: archemetzincin [candidate division WOR-3 bacterium]|nr:archemetzincin [candidate division WOR-3 bacterium]MCX7757909.1 archemetzincin [candidate division WOR-3 bacterium]MDW7987864.1 archemetzincin [candidate division WOR-3 bacterium]